MTKLMILLKNQYLMSLKYHYLSNIPIQLKMVFFQNNLIRIIIYPNLHAKKKFFFMHNYAEKNY